MPTIDEVRRALAEATMRWVETQDEGDLSRLVDIRLQYETRLRTDTGLGY